MKERNGEDWGGGLFVCCDLPYSPVNSQRAGPGTWHLKVLLVNIWVNKLRLNPLRFKGFSPLFLKPQEGALLGTGEGMGRQSLVCSIFSVKSRGKVHSEKKVSSSNLEYELISYWRANKKHKMSQNVAYCIYYNAPWFFSLNSSWISFHMST